MLKQKCRQRNFFLCSPNSDALVCVTPSLLPPRYSLLNLSSDGLNWSLLFIAPASFRRFSSRKVLEWSAWIGLKGNNGAPLNDFHVGGGSVHQWLGVRTVPHQVPPLLSKKKSYCPPRSCYFLIGETSLPVNTDWSITYFQSRGEHVRAGPQPTSPNFYIHLLSLLIYNSFWILVLHVEVKTKCLGSD